MKQDWKHLGKVIRRDRRASGMRTQADLAAAAGLSLRLIGYYEQGREPETAPAIPEGYYDVARALGWTRRSIKRVLAGGEPDMAKQPEDVRLADVPTLMGRLLRFTDTARDLGAPDDLVERCRGAVTDLYVWMAGHLNEVNAAERERFRLAASRPQALGQGVPPDDAERIFRAMEADK